MSLKQALLAGLVLLTASASMAQTPTPSSGINNPGPSAPGEWTIYPGSYNSQRHSPLKQVTPANVHLLQVK